MQIVAQHSPMSEDTRVRTALSIADYKGASKLMAQLALIGVSVTLADARVVFQAANKEWSEAMSERLVS